MRSSPVAIFSLGLVPNFLLFTGQLVNAVGKRRQGVTRQVAQFMALATKVLAVHAGFRLSE